MNGAFVPPWIKPANETQNFLTGFQIGQRRAALELQAQEKMAEQELQAQRIAEQAMINRERIAATAQAQAQQRALKQQELALKAQEAGTRLIGLRDMQADVAAGMAEDQAFSKHAWKILGTQAGPFYAAKARQAAAQRDVTPKVMTIEGRKYLVKATGGAEAIYEGDTGLETLTDDQGRDVATVYTDTKGKQTIHWANQPGEMKLKFDPTTKEWTMDRATPTQIEAYNKAIAAKGLTATNAPVPVPSFGTRVQSLWNPSVLTPMLTPPSTVATNAPASNVLPTSAASNLMAQMPELQRQIATNAPPKVRVRRKSDGKEFLYHGSAADVPKDKFEVLE